MTRARTAAQPKALEFKGRTLSLTRARILDPNLEAIERQLRDFARQMPAAVQGLPLVLDGSAPESLPRLLTLMRELGMQPIAAVDGALAEAARASGLPVLPPDVLDEAVSRPAAAPPPTQSAAPSPVRVVTALRRPARIVTEPVRSGQQVYAEDADLVLLKSVSAGAEVIADGCVHVYGRLSGRAIAGARGDAGARVFVRKHEAELLAVAGIYATAEQMSKDLSNRSTQAYLVDGQLKIERFE